jgi:cytochrome b561
MSLKSTPDRYGSVAIAIHWLSALAVVMAFAGGLVLANSAEGSVPILVAHMVLGLSAFALTLLRIVWWLALDKQPAPAAGQSRLQQRAAKIVHGLLYVILILMATSGIMTLLLSGALPAIASGGPLPDFSELGPRMAHGIASRVLLVLLAIHIGAALYHQFIRRDRLLARMGIGAGS